MRKLVKLMTTITISTAALQTTACKDDSKYDSFLNDINQSENTNSAFFGFLGSANDSISSSLQTSFDYLNQKDTNNDDKTGWQKIIDEEAKKIEINNIQLRYYQGPYNQNKPEDIITSFWNDKNITWQKSIFNWIYNNTKRKNNPDFKIPIGVNEVEGIISKKDDTEKEMFTKLPIVFIISKGKLITAGQNWISADSSRSQQIEAIRMFVLANLFLD